MTNLQRSEVVHERLVVGPAIPAVLSMQKMWNALQHYGPNHLGLWLNGLSSNPRGVIKGHDRHCDAVANPKP